MTYEKRFEILIIEDQLRWFEAIKRSLTAITFSFDHAADLTTAQSKLKSKRYDIIISDLKLSRSEPLLSALGKLIFAMQQDNSHGPMMPPIVVVTGYEFESGTPYDVLNNFGGLIWGWHQKRDFGDGLQFHRNIENVTKHIREKEQLLAIEHQKTEDAQTQASVLRSQLDELTNQNSQLTASLEAANAKSELLAKQLFIRRDYLRIGLATVIAVIATILLILMPSQLDWGWLRDHPNRLGLYGCALIMIWAVAWAVGDWNATRRNYALGVMAFNGVFVLLQIIGR